MKYQAMALATALLLSSAVQAGPYVDDLARCFVKKATASDRIVYIQWMYASMSRHPAIAPMGSVSQAEVDKANQRMADLFTRLITDACRDQAKVALVHESRASLNQSFRQFGQVAGTDIFANPEVMKSALGYMKYVDVKRFAGMKSP